LILSTIVVAAIGCVLPFTGVGRALGLKALPSGYWGLLAATLVAYVVLAHWVKSRFMRRFGLN
jgi:Mg2+-importing ATPase